MSPRGSAMGERSGLVFCMPMVLGGPSKYGTSGEPEVRFGWHYQNRGGLHSPRAEHQLLRRSACQTPEQAPLPPLQEPPPLVAASLPVPVAVLSPAATFTTTAPFFSTLPVMVTAALPALSTLPLLMRIG